MGVPTPGAVKRVRGRLSWNPTDLTQDYPHGGTALGLARDHEFQPNIEHKKLAAEEWGGSTASVLYTGEDPMFLAVLRDFDADALATVWPNVRTTLGGRVTLTYRPGDESTNLPGTQLDDTHAGLLVFTPDDEDQHDWIIIYRAVPVVQVAAAMALHLDEDLGFPVAWIGTPDSNGDVYEWGPKQTVKDLI